MSNGVVAEGHEFVGDGVDASSVIVGGLIRRNSTSAQTCCWCGGFRRAIDVRLKESILSMHGHDDVKSSPTVVGLVIIIGPIVGDVVVVAAVLFTAAVLPFVMLPVVTKPLALRGVLAESVVDATSIRPSSLYR